MAIEQTYVAANTVGTRREDYITVTFNGVTSGIVKTRLHWIEALAVEDASGQDATYDSYPNSDTASATEDDPGHAFFTGVASGEVFSVRFIGW